MSLGAIAFSKDGKLLTYSISKGGSDWQELKMMRIDQGSGKAEELKDVLKHVKFSSTAWTHDHKVRQSRFLGCSSCLRTPQHQRKQ